MSACPEMEGLLAERASGDVQSEDAARLDAHLAACDGCQRELRAYQETFQLARVPPAEGRIADLDVSTFSAYQRRRRRRVTGWTLGAGFVAAAVAASMVIAPALLTLRSLPRPSHAVTAAESVASEGEDATGGAAESFYADDSTFGSVAGTDEYQGNGGTQLAMSSSSASESVDPEDAALAAFDESDTP
jgi:hypothetical protein